MTTAQGPLLKAVSTCRVCRAKLDTNAPLFHMPRVPLAGAYLRPGASEQRRSEVAGPLSLTTCESCGLTQLLQSLDGRFYRDYSFAGGGGGAYRDYLHSLASDLSTQFERGAFVLEVGSGDGTLLAALRDQGMKVAGFEPADGPRAIALNRGLDVHGVTFDPESWSRSGLETPELIITRHVLEHIEDFDAIFAGFAAAAGEHTWLVVEVPDLSETVKGDLYGNIYHPHPCYFDVDTLRGLLNRHGWAAGKGCIVPTFGGSVLLVARRAGQTPPTWLPAVAIHEASSTTNEALQGFVGRWDRFGTSIRDGIRALAAEGHSVAGYGAAERTAALVGCSHLAPGDIACIFDRNPQVMGAFFPGLEAEIRHPDSMVEDPPDHLVIFAQSHEDEIVDQLSAYRAQGGRCYGIRPHGLVTIGAAESP